MKKYKIPYINLIEQHSLIKKDILEAVSRVLDSGQFILGEEVEKFEAGFAKLCNVQFAIGVNSGTDALILALRALGIGKGDEVITVPNSFIASTSCILLVGARPVFVDVADDYNMDPTQLAKAITSRTKAILPVHLTGRPAEMDAIMEKAKKHNLYVIEDCAQAVLAEYKGRRVGSIGTMGCFSFHPLKTLNACGDGGIVTTNDEKLAEKLKIMRNLGLKNRNECIMWSGNSRLDSLQAAILLVKMKYVEEWIEKRRANADFYRQGLSDIPYIQAPMEREYERAVYHTFIIQCEHRDELKHYLEKNGIESAIHYPIPIHLQEVSKDLGYRKGSFEVTEAQAEHILSLPVYPELKASDIKYIIQTIKRFYQFKR